MQVATHNGRFHCDDVVACMLIDLISQDEIDIVRTRDPGLIIQANWVVDVGGKYNPELNQFDHHQKECNETWSAKYPILLSSSGMVFKHYWNEILQAFGFENATQEEADLVYERIFLPIDAHDNGQQTKEYYISITKTNFPDGVQMGQVVANMNADDVNSEKQNERFRYAMKYTFESICPMISSIIKDIRNNKRIIEQILTQNIDDALKTGILVLQDGTWVNHYILSKIDPNKKLYFTIYKKGQNYGFSSIQEKGFKNRIDLIPYSNEYSDLVFIHKNLFCGEATSLNTAYAVCQKSIKQYRLQRNIKIGAGVVVGGSILYFFKNLF